MRNSRPILFVEDDKIDVMMMKRAMDELQIANEFVHKVNGEEALQYLRNGGEKPALILFDLNMPKMNGPEFVRELKTDDTLKKIPAIVMTTSEYNQDIADAFELGVAGYMVKPADYNNLVETIRVIDLYWTLSRLPDSDE